MEIKIDYSAELVTLDKKQIDFIRGEFDEIFGHKKRFTKQDHKIAKDLLNYLSKLIDTPVCLDALSDTLKYLEKRYAALF
jgi:hypothetical protein